MIPRYTGKGLYRKPFPEIRKASSGQHDRGDSGCKVDQEFLTFLRKSNIVRVGMNGSERPIEVEKKSPSFHAITIPRG